MATSKAETVTISLQRFTRLAEVRQYAEQHTSGDLGAAIIELVNTSLSYRSGKWGEGSIPADAFQNPSYEKQKAAQKGGEAT